MTENNEARERDFSHLPPRVQPEDMVEIHDEEQVNETGAPAGDPDTNFTIRHA
jgi:hypothetical protein